MDTFYKASVTDPAIGVATLAKWVRNVASPGDESIARALTIARTMIFGVAWDIEYHWQLKEHPAPAGVAITSYEVPTDADIWLAEARGETVAQKELLQRAANGDAAAAIKYCQMELAGEIYHPPGPAYA